jgi:branched-chain amino acid transport system substrate-binding protein
MEGLKRKDLLGSDNKMRKDDHQILSEYIVGQFVKGVKYDSEGTGLGWKVAAVVLEGKDLAQPTSCQMKVRR